MSEVSNKTLSVLLIGAIIVSLGGTLISLNKINGVMRMQTITGMVGYDKGMANLSIQSQASLIFTNDVVNFGSGYVSTTSNCTNCTMNTTGYQSMCCRGDWLTAPTSGLLLQNVGNEPMNVQMVITKNGSTLIGGTNTSLNNASLEYKITEASARAGQGGDTAASCGGAWRPDFSAGWNYTRIVEDQQFYICGTGATYPFLPDDTQDEVVIDVQVRVPNTARGSAKNMTFNVTGTASG